MAKLKEWKRSSNTRLAFNQQFLIDYIQTILSWTTATVKETVNLLMAASLNFHNLEIDETQTLITEYLTPRLYINDVVE